MKTIFDQNAIDELTARIAQISPQSKAQWGKMDAFQMVKHCGMSEEIFQGKRNYKRLFAGRLFGKMALGSILKNQGEMKRGLPTHPDLKITGTGDIEAEKLKWIGLLKAYTGYSNNNFIHPFFGKMNGEQVGAFVYKHTDHHLKQFAV
ncbi:MAG: DUF1569 domain-containing protein [Mucilaginibacter sp.]